jgi:hypothetical protein
MGLPLNWRCDMPCEGVRRRGQSLSQRKAEIKKVTERVSALLASGKVKAKVGPQGAIAFEGIPQEIRDDVRDGCLYRQIITSGSAAAKLKILQAEQLAGRSIDRKIVAQGVHSHDGGHTFHAKG